MGKRVIQLVTVGTALIMPLAVGGIVAADAANNCNIYNTGTDSYNACVADNNNQTYVTCVNDVYTVYTNTQSSSSGNANNNSNTSSGNTTTGSAVNSNGTDVTIGANCGTPVTATTPGTGGGVTTTTTPTTPTAQPVAKPAATVLPETGSNAVTVGAVIGLIAAAGIFTFSKIGSTMLQRRSLK